MKKIFIKSFSKNLLENKITVSCVFEISYYSGTSFTEQQIQLTMGEISNELTMNNLVQAIANKLNLSVDDIGVITELSAENLEKIKNIIIIPNLNLL